jgi:hypothetical protein
LYSSDITQRGAIGKRQREKEKRSRDERKVESGVEENKGMQTRRERQFTHTLKRPLIDSTL